MRVGIIGGGIFGTVIGATLAQAGCAVEIFDCGKKNSGTGASGFLMKPSWFGNMKKEDSKEALDRLDAIYGLQTLKFYIGPVHTRVYRIEWRHWFPVPWYKLFDQRIVAIKDNRYLIEEHGGEWKFDWIIIAAGIWSNDFIDLKGLGGKTGVSFKWKDVRLEKNIIKAWAPFKQVVAYNIPEKNEVWAGDGTAILDKNWEDSRIAECFKRVSSCTNFKFSKLGAVNTTVGIRPYFKTKDPCLLQRLNSRVWLASGGSKNGTIAAAWAANQILKALP